MGYAHVFSARGATGKDYLERALALGEELVDDESIGYACLGLMFYYLFWAEPSDDNRTTFIELGDLVMAIAEKSNDVWLAAKCLNCRRGEAGTSFTIAVGPRTALQGEETSAAGPCLSRRGAGDRQDGARG